MKKRIVTVMYDGTNYTLEWLRALIWAKDYFIKKNIIIEFEDGYNYELEHDNKKIYYKDDYKRIVERWRSKKYDVVLLAYHDVGILGEYKRRKELLPLLRKRVNWLVWLDTVDSSGTCNFDVLPYVDRYLKKQLLKDTSCYMDVLYGGRIYVDYYRKKFRVTDELFDNEKNGLVLDKIYLQKLGLCWNRGLGDKFGLTKQEKTNYIDTCAPWKFHEVKKRKKYDIHYKVTIRNGAIAFQRQRIKQLLEKCSWIRMPSIDKKIPYEEYIREFIDARAVISPFGWGEICYRDFDAFAYGITLIKPNMDHIKTYPNWYINGETYLSLNWDFSDFYDVMEYVCSGKNNDNLMRIAKKGQQLFKSKIDTCRGRDEFVKHFCFECKI